MRKVLICGAVLLGLCQAMAATATTLGPFNVTFDEYGNSTGGLTSYVGLDPTSGVPGNVLIYILPRTVIGGDIRVWEDQLGGTLSDILRFTNENGVFDGSFSADRFIFYSLSGGGAPADSGLPGNLAPNDAGGVVEQGAPGSRHFDWLPGGDADNQYHGLSDGRLGASQVPEPGGIAMLAGLAVPGIVLVVRRRSRG